MTEFVPSITLTQSLNEPLLFGKTFSSPSFWTWKTVAKLIDGLPLIEQREIELFEKCTGRSTQLPNRHDRRLLRRFILLCGRRAGKDRFLSSVAVWRAALCTDWRKYLSPGEQAVVVLLGRDKKQASILRRYCQGLLQVPALAREVTRSTGDLTEFRNGSVLEIANNDASLVRGRSAIAVLGSEANFWKHDERSASSDEEVVGAAEPSMAMCVDGGLLLLGSSVGRRAGYMFRKYSELHGNNEADDVCWFAPSTTMNPRLRQSVIDQALREDPHRAAAEYEGVWREDTKDFCPLDVIEACTDFDTYERPPQYGVHYKAFCDAAGGTGADSFTICIAHCLNDDVRTVVIDVLRERKPRFVPADTIKEFAALLKSYGITEVQGDKFAGGFHSDEWRRNNIMFKAAEFTTSEGYLRALPMFLSKRARLINSSTLRHQLASLERHVSSGHETVRHPAVASAHDDLATSCCGAMAVVGDRLAFNPAAMWSVDDEPINNLSDADKQRRENEANASWRQHQMYLHILGGNAGSILSPRTFVWR